MMLVLSRKNGQQIKIGDQITLVVKRIRGNTVSIGVKAPPDMKVLRSEIEDQDKGQEGHRYE